MKLNTLGLILCGLAIAQLPAMHNYGPSKQPNLTPAQQEAVRQVVQDQTREHNQLEGEHNRLEQERSVLLKRLYDNSTHVLNHTLDHLSTQEAIPEISHSTKANIKRWIVTVENQQGALNKAFQNLESCVRSTAKPGVKPSQACQEQANKLEQESDKVAALIDQLTK